jgi:hypothetical protein
LVVAVAFTRFHLQAGRLWLGLASIDALGTVEVLGDHVVTVTAVSH